MAGKEDTATETAKADSYDLRAPTVALVSFLLCVFSWQLTATMFACRWLFGPRWFGPNQEWAAFGLSVVLSIYHWLWGRQLLRKHYRTGKENQRSPTAAVIVVVVIIVAEGAFMTWLFCH